MRKPTMVMKLGGSLLFDEKGPKMDYFKRIVPVIKTLQEENDLILIVGMGKYLKSYVDRFKGMITNAQMECVSIDLLHGTADLFSFLLDGVVAREMREMHNLRRCGRTVVMDPSMPGYSTDMDAAIAAEYFGADMLVKLTNIDGIYTGNPKKDKNAKRYERIRFEDIAEICSKQEFSPNAYGVLDYVASKIIARSKVKTLVISGSNPDKITENIEKKNGTIIG